MKRDIQGVTLFHFQDVWVTQSGRFEITADGFGVTKCCKPHVCANGMMCPGKINHEHSTWWVWDSVERCHVFGTRSFNTLSDAANALDTFLTTRGR